MQEALERHFASFQPIEGSWADIACVDTHGKRWVIEAKGETSDTGLDFRTDLGQLIQGMDDPGTHYALAMPDTVKFERQRQQVPPWVRAALGLSWILVNESGELTVQPPPGL